MAKIETLLTGGFTDTVERVVRGVMEKSVSATLEEESDWEEDGVRCAVRVLERYSAFGGNRLSLNLTFFGRDGRIRVSAVTAGGSQAMFFKINTIGEETFLGTVQETLDGLR